MSKLMNIGVDIGVPDGDMSAMVIMTRAGEILELALTEALMVPRELMVEDARIMNLHIPTGYGGLKMSRLDYARLSGCVSTCNPFRSSFINERLEREPVRRHVDSKIVNVKQITGEAL